MIQVNFLYFIVFVFIFRLNLFVDVKKEVPPRPPQPDRGVTQQNPSQVPSNLPYPVYVQGMPVPFGASTSAPYPSYAATPMPQGYNPYGSMPYPGTINTYIYPHY